MANGEVKRIGGIPRQSLEQAREFMLQMTARRADGQELRLADIPMSQIMRNAQTVRAEEIVLQTRDGRTVSTLVNATPIRSEEGKVESVIVTMQDMTPLEQAERLRAEFLGMVSHELRMPLTSIKGSADTLLESLSSLDAAEVVQFVGIIKSQSAERMRDLISELLDVARIETGALSVSQNAVDVAGLVDEARNTFLSGMGGDGANIVLMDLEPDLPRVMADSRRIVQVLGNLLSNAARYSPASAPIRVSAGRRDRYVAIEVADEGQGVPPEEPAVPVPQVLAGERRRRGRACRGFGPGPGDLQGNRGGPRRAHLGGERRAGQGNAVHVHDSGGVGYGRGGAGGAPGAGGRRAAGREERGAHPGGGRRPARSAVRAEHTLQGGLRADGDGRPGGGASAGEVGAAHARDTGPGAAGRGRHRTDAEHHAGREDAGDLSFGVRAGRGDRAGVRGGGGGLHRQAVLPYRVGDEGAGRAAGPAGGDGGAVGAVPVGRPRGRLRGAPG